MKAKSQGRTLVEAMKKRALTYGDMMELMRWRSCSPWKRCAEALRGDEVIVRRKNANGLTTWRVKMIPLADRA